MADAVGLNTVWNINVNYITGQNVGVGTMLMFLKYVFKNSSIVKYYFKLK